MYKVVGFFFLNNFFFRVGLRLTPVSSCVSCVGLLVQDLTDTILSSYAYKSHYLLTESNRAELKLPMIPSPSSATKKNVGKGNCTLFLFTPLSLCCVSVMCLLLRLLFTFPSYASIIPRPWDAKLINWFNAVNSNAEWHIVTSAMFPQLDNNGPRARTVPYSSHPQPTEGRMP